MADTRTRAEINEAFNRTWGKPHADTTKVFRGSLNSDNRYAPFEQRWHTETVSFFAKAVQA